MGIFNPQPTAPSFTPKTTSELFEDFVGVVTPGVAGGLFKDWQYDLDGAGSTVNGTASTVNTIPGKLRFDVAAVAGRYASIFIGQSGQQFFNTPPSLLVLIRFQQTSAAIAGHTQRLGIMAQPGGAEPTGGIYFRSVGVGNWFGVCRTGGVESTLDLSIAQDTNFHTFQITTNAAGTSALFNIDNVDIGSIATNLPAGGQLSQLCMQNVGTAAGGGTFDIDYAYYKISALTR